MHITLVNASSVKIPISFFPTFMETFLWVEKFCFELFAPNIMHVPKKEKEKKKGEEGAGGVRPLVGGWGLWRDMGKRECGGERQRHLWK